MYFRRVSWPNLWFVHFASVLCRGAISFPPVVVILLFLGAPGWEHDIYAASASELPRSEKESIIQVRPG